jgi:hypothetical protein|tara:strand:+ start:172 stop:468 length:297 start_codon:yes stop_codon:yes gene_type:complete
MEGRINVPDREKKGGMIRTWWGILSRLVAALDTYSEYLVIRNETRLLKAYGEMAKSEYKEDIQESAVKNVTRVSRQLKTSMLMFFPLLLLLIIIQIIF